MTALLGGKLLLQSRLAVIQQQILVVLEAAFDFMEQAFAESQEMVVFVTELTVNPASHQFLTENGCERYFKYNKGLMVAMMAVFGQSLVSSLKNPVYLVLSVLLWGGMYWVSKKFCRKHHLE